MGFKEAIVAGIGLAIGTLIVSTVLGLVFGGVAVAAAPSTGTRA